MKLKQALLTCISILIVLVSLSYYYVFIAGSPQLDPPKIQANTGLTFQQASLNSKAMGTVRRYGVILPPDYNRHPKEQYPVIFLLHGGHDNYRAYYDKYAVTSVLHQLYTAGKLPPTIVITPDGNDNRGSSPLWDPQYYDGANGNLGTLIGSELVQVVKSSYRTLPNPQFWVIGGVSPGGWGANLLRRKRVAWLLTVSMLVVSIISHLIKGLDYEESLLALILLVQLLLMRSVFTAQSDRPSIAQGVQVLIIALLFTLAYGTLGFFLLDGEYSMRFDFPEALLQTLAMFFTADNCSDPQY